MKKGKTEPNDLTDSDTALKQVYVKKKFICHSLVVYN